MIDNVGLNVPTSNIVTKIILWVYGESSPTRRITKHGTLFTNIQEKTKHRQLLTRGTNMQFVTVIFLALAFTCCIGDKLDDANSYLDEVLTDYLPSTIEAEGLTVYEMPNFSHNHQERTSDGAVLNTKVFYWAGNLTGLQNVLRESCEQPSWSSGNVSVACRIVLPDLRAEYKGRFQSIKGFNNPFGVQVRQFDFTLYIDVRQVEVELEVTSSPRIQIPSVKQLNLVSRGDISMNYHTEASFSEDVTEGVEHRFNEFFDDLFSGPFKRALETAVGSVRYPKNEIVVFLIKFPIKSADTKTAFALFKVKGFSVVKGEKMRLSTVAFLAFAFVCCTGYKLDEASEYMDEVLSIYVPWAVEEDDLEVYKMPLLSYNVHQKQPDGAVVNNHTMFGSGNMTGLQNLYRKSCEKPITLASGNISVICNIVLPKIHVECQGRFQSTRGYNNPFTVHVRQYDFDIKMNSVNLEAQLEVTSDPRLKLPSMRNVTLISKGEISTVIITDAPHEQFLIDNFVGTYDEFFQDFFEHGRYREKVLNRAVGSVLYPEDK
ncbi:hypothetical protein AVEN_12600-1 [Araneus ventricosus]|uniref:Uncharacterized protein n=1 Tax=Araneus ventricosus TaxID=182803 RepID=A0A4Y2AD78_ARAVE|nr:hypothetical protein AVEN_12600-1 [Araneus ventricosus]